MKNEALIEHLRSDRNAIAIKELYLHYPSVRQFIKTHGGNEDDARDVFQESLIVLYKNSAKPDFKLTSAVGTYLFSICKYMWKDLLKKKGREVSFEVENMPDAWQEINTHLEEEKKYRQVDEVLKSLGEKCLEILNTFYYKHFSMEKIANLFGYKNIDTAKTQKYKCLERARKMAMERYGNA